MKKRVLVPVANGTEEMEAVIVIDMLRRAQIEVTIAAEECEVVCSRGVKIIPDKNFSEISEENFDMIILPGGAEGTENLKKNFSLKKILQRHKAEEKFLAAICAAPTILAEHHLIEENTRITSHPSRKNFLEEKFSYSEDKTVRDGKIITSRGAGTAFEFALELIKILRDGETAEKIAQDIVLIRDN